MAGTMCFHMRRVPPHSEFRNWYFRTPPLTDSHNDIGNLNRGMSVKTTLTFTKGVVNLSPHSPEIVNASLK
jgi:hypothetical protein